MLENEFSGKVAFVTGGASGIGAAVSRLLAARGAKVCVADLNLGSASVLAAEIGGEAVAVDVRNPQSVEKAVSTCMEKFGALHLGVNSAGVTGGRTPAGEYDLGTWSQVIDINLNGVFYSLRYEVAAIRASGGGAIVNLASILGAVGLAGAVAYTAAKHGVVGLTRAAAADYAEHKIRINAIGPGYVDTPLLSGRSDIDISRIAALHPMKRMAKAEEIAETIAYLLSDRASFITGSFIMADGGYSAV